MTDDFGHFLRMQKPIIGHVVQATVTIASRDGLIKLERAQAKPKQRGRTRIAVTKTVSGGGLARRQTFDVAAN